MTTKWLVRHRQAAERDLAEALALGRQDVKRRADADREREALERDARKVGTAIRKAEWAARKMHFPLRAYPAFIEGRREGRTRIKRFERALDLSLPRKVGGGRVSSFHFRFRGRGLGHHRRAKGYPYKRGEAVRAIRYILRNSAREIAEGGIVSSISQCPDEIASLFAALEELECAAGRTNAQVFWSLVISLPHELTADQRLELLDEICGTFADLGLPFAAVLHAPDADGDERNYHAHVVGSWRPFRIEPDGSYSLSERTLSMLNTTEGILEQRELAAAAMNRAMMAAGLERRFSHLTNAKRGLAPASKAAGKSSIAQKNRERKLRTIEAMRSERGLLEERRFALERLGANVAELAKIATMELGNIVTNLLTAERRISDSLARHVRTASSAESIEAVSEQGAAAAAFNGPSEPSPVPTLQPGRLATVPVARESADAIAIDSHNVQDAPADAQPPVVTVQAMEPISSDDALAPDRVPQRDTEVSPVSHEKPSLEGAFNTQRKSPGKLLDHKSPGDADQIAPGSDSGPIGIVRAMPTRSPTTVPGMARDITGESAMAANGRGNREQHPISANSSENKVSFDTPSESSKQVNAADVGGAEEKDRTAKRELAKPTQAQLMAMSAKIAGRRKATASGKGTTRRELNDLETVGEVLAARDRGKDGAVPSVASSSHTVSGSAEGNHAKVDGSWARGPHGSGEPEALDERDPLVVENMEKMQPEAFSPLEQADDDDRRKRRRKRKIVSRIAEKTAGDGLAETGVPDTAASALQSDRTIDLALIAELFHSTEWDPRELGTDKGAGRRPDRWPHAIAEAEDLEHFSLLSALATRSGNSRF